MKILGNSIYLLPFAEENFNDAYISWLGDFEVIKYLGRDEYFSPTPKSEIYRYVQEMWDSKFIYFFAIYLKDNNRFIGTAKINFLNDRGLKNKICDIGIMIGDRVSWGKGLASETINIVSKYAFEDLDARKLSAGAIAENIAVIKAFKKNGFIEEAKLRKTVNVQGKFFDHILLGCFRGELRGDLTSI